jgi:hypothetical protein
MRQERLQHPHRPEHAGLEHRPHRLGGHLGDRHEPAVRLPRLDAGVVDQHVDPAVGLDRRG